MSSLFSLHPFRKKKTIIHTLCTFGQTQGITLVLKKTSSLAYASHKLELKLSFRCPTEGCSNNWAFLQKLANLTITLFKNKLCIGLSAYLSVFGDLHQGERFQCIESRRRKKTCCFLPWYLQMPSL